MTTAVKLLVSVALLGTVGNCQNGYTAYSPGSQYTHNLGLLQRGAPRLVQAPKVIASASRLVPTYAYPYPSPSQNHAQHVPFSYPTFARHLQYPHYRPTGFYRPRKYFGGFEAAQSLTYRAPVQYTSPAHSISGASPAVLKRGRVLPAPSPYATAAQSIESPAGSVAYPQGFPAYRVAAQPQIAAAPVHHPQHQLLQQPEPQYYVQKAPAARPLKAVKAYKNAPPTTDAVDPEEQEYPSDPNPQYNFSFDIKDDELTNYQNRQEERDGQTIKGSYSVVDPDGYVRTVTYTADAKNGFQAKVTREPTDVKIKFPVPTEAPLEQKHAGPRGQAYAPQTQYQHQPQYQVAAGAPQYQQAQYATPQQVYATQAQPAYVPRAGRFVIQPHAASAQPQPRIVARYPQHQQ